MNNDECKVTLCEPLREWEKRPRSPRWALLRRYVIPDIRNPRQPYLVRWRLLQTPWFAIYLHKICQPDQDRHLHDHPWPFVSIVLRGGYDEVRPHGYRSGARVGEWWPARYEKRRGCLSIAFRRSTDLHRISRLHRRPTWTLLLVGPRRRDWGYSVGGRWISHDIYHREHLGLVPEAYPR